MGELPSVALYSWPRPAMLVRLRCSLSEMDGTNLLVDLEYLAGGKNPQRSITLSEECQRALQGDTDIIRDAAIPFALAPATMKQVLSQLGFVAAAQRPSSADFDGWLNIAREDFVGARRPGPTFFLDTSLGPVYT